jgi:enterochelin esterase family protein
MQTLLPAVPAMLAVLLAQAPAKPEPPPPLGVRELRAALAARPAGTQAAELADKLRRWLGKDLTEGDAARAEGTDVAFAIEAPGARDGAVISLDGQQRFRLEPVGETGLLATVVTLADGAAMRWAFDVGGARRGGGQLEVYTVHPESLPRAGVPRGKLTQQKRWKSTVFEGTERDWWVYVPAQVRASQPAAVMVFQDGGSYIKQVPTVFDNLIHKGDMPPTVGIFIDPGVFADGRRNRSFEYDTLSDQYARFLLEEILPEVEKTVKLRKDPAGRAISGASSGGICSFTVAWERPNEFGKVLSWIGSFTNIASGKTLREGGHNYPALIRKTPRKPIRVFLQDGVNDLDNNHGSWPLANKEMEKALAFAGYDSKVVWGNGFHSHLHGRAILPDSLRWLWRDHRPAAPAAKP